MRKYIFLLMAIPFGAALHAQNYSAALIPDSLIKNANAVKRSEELIVTIFSPSKAICIHKWAVTILNESGDKYATYINEYTKLISLSDISGHLYDATGKQLKSIKKKDIIDQSRNDGETLVSDSRVKAYDFYYKQYPYTVEYEDEQDFDGILFLPEWQPVVHLNYSVQQSTFSVNFPADYKLRYKQFNYSSKPVISSSKTNTYTWSVNNLKPLEFEPLHPPLNEITTAVFISPATFEFGGYTGNMETWKDFGKFIYQLKEGRDVLPENVKQDIHRLTDNVTDNHEKIRILYEYLQKNTHYVGIQIGIGGYQPFEAKYVATTGYGDCKALSNYMTSILKEAGINANYVLVTSGEGEKGLWEDFPSPYFDHVIMCVPGDNDTTWLECTSQTQSPGFMGSFTGDRKALMISKDGGFVINTPKYKSSDNLELKSIHATVDESGNLLAEVNTEYTGISQEHQHDLIYGANKEEQKDYLNKAFNLPTYTVEKSDYKEVKGKIPRIDEYLKIAAPDYATITGKRLFIRPNILSATTYKLDKDKPRKFPIEYPYAFKEVDSAFISLPSGYSPEALPGDLSINNKFGKYSISFKIDGDKINMLRVYERQANVYPATDYNDLAKFYDEMYKADRSRIVLVKKEN